MVLYLLYRGIRDNRYFTGCPERLGFLPASFDSTPGGSIWLHAVSVGEITSSLELVRRLKNEHPSIPLFVSTTTLAGRETADRMLGGVVDGVFFAPIDYRSVIRRILRTLRPALVVVIETEIWPNLYRESKRAGAALLVANGRMSDRAWPRYRKWRGFFRHVLRWPDAILAQSEEDARRYVLAGAPADHVRAMGNLKYDFVPPAAGMAHEIAAFLDVLKPEKVWIAASTMAPAVAGDIDEDDAVIGAFQQIARPGLLLILVPRKPERFDVVAAKLTQAGVSFVRRTALKPLALPGVLLLDSIGELAALYAIADVVFMGGTLAARGGHNSLEPAYFGKPVIAGPHMENFAEIAREFEKAGAIWRIPHAGELCAAVAALLDDRAAADSMGAKGRELVQAKRGITERNVREIWNAYAHGVVDPPHRLVELVFFGPLTLLWRAGRAAGVTKSRALRRELRTPVVSVGGLTMGGVGKSPMVAHLASRLRAAGRNPAILTRGYRRRSAEPVVIVERGHQAAAALTGDEAQIFLRRGDAHVGIGKDRFAVGTSLERQLQPDILLLDDGFQHGRLARKHDIVLIDALDPFGGGMFPLGRSREPVDALRRATVLLVTRSEPGVPIAGLEMLLRPYNTEAPIFRSWVKPLEWIEISTGERRPAHELGVKRVGAFCGLGNPRSFWKTLEGSGLDVAFRWAFEDHHSYLPDELRRLTQQGAAVGAEALVTTEKDSLNLFEGAAALIAPLKLYWLKIGIEIENEEELLRLLA
ncbi:MAG TPA: tetraacyldisaccharide 4'-kinase [Bryobacteraceae bacterium]|nr:tetraacyldisaccharide 4'-kinase [Bryobacteraceae bacterium]